MNFKSLSEIMGAKPHAMKYTSKAFVLLCSLIDSCSDDSSCPPKVANLINYTC